MSSPSRHVVVKEGKMCTDGGEDGLGVEKLSLQSRWETILYGKMGITAGFLA